MRKSSILALAAIAAALSSPGPAAANGGMGDSSAHVREMQAICEAQKRGEIPRNPDACLPRFPNQDGSATPMGR